MFTSDSKAGPVGMSRPLRRMQTGVLQRESLPVANWVENSGTEKAPLNSVPQGQRVLGIGIIFQLDWIKLVTGSICIKVPLSAST